MTSKKKDNLDFSGALDNNYSKKELLELFSKFLEQREALSEKKIPAKKEFDNIIPISLFKNPVLSSLEIIVKYLKEEFNFSFHEIAVMLNRNDRTIWSTYDNSKRKFPERFIAGESSISIPSSIFKDRNLGVLELICEYLKDYFSLSYHEIAVMLNRNDRTIWTAYHRAKNKRSDEKK